MEAGYHTIKINYYMMKRKLSEHKVQFYRISKIGHHSQNRIFSMLFELKYLVI